MIKLTKYDYKENKFNIGLTAFYTFAMMLVYGSWSYIAFKMVWLSALICVLLLLGGIVCGYVWTLYEKKERMKQAKIEQEKRIASYVN